MAFDPYKRIAELETLLAKALARIDELEARLNRNSKNSSTPPSANPPGVPKSPSKKPSGRKPGGQPGHPGSHRAMVEPHDVIDHAPLTCDHCDAPLPEAITADPIRHQVAELPPICVTIVEHRLHRRTCGDCGRHTRASLPPGVPSSQFGPRLTAVIAMLSSRFRVTRREAAALCNELFGTTLSVGSVQALCERTSEAVRVPAAEAVNEVLASSVLHADETGYPHRARKAWLWMASSGQATIFKLHAKRGKDGLAALIPDDYKGTVVTDRWHAYKRFKRRELCHAHLLRNWTAIAERKHPDAKRIGEWAVSETRCLLRWHRQYREGTITRDGLLRRMWLLKGRYAKLLRLAKDGDDPKTQSLARNLESQWDSLWTFVTTPGVEPTNNEGERKIRPAVLWRKGSFGTWSTAGQRFVERTLTISATAKQQGVRLVDFLHAATAAHVAGTRPPSLFAARDRRLLGLT